MTKKIATAALVVLLSASSAFADSQSNIGGAKSQPSQSSQWQGMAAAGAGGR
jgi:opacity protein-like surface antigen